jgi:hypothetical protein
VWFSSRRRHPESSVLLVLDLVVDDVVVFGFVVVVGFGFVVVVVVVFGFVVDDVVVFGFVVVVVVGLVVVGLVVVVSFAWVVVVSFVLMSGVVVAVAEPVSPPSSCGQGRARVKVIVPRRSTCSLLPGTQRITWQSPPSRAHPSCRGPC